MFVCNCFGITEEQVRQHAADGCDSPRRIASACKAGTDCGSCVRRIQSLLGRGDCPRRAPSDTAPAAPPARRQVVPAAVLAAADEAPPPLTAAGTGRLDEAA